MQYLPAQSALIRCVALTFRKSKPEDTQALVAKLTRTQPTGSVAVSLQVRVDMWTASLIDVQAVSRLTAFPTLRVPITREGLAGSTHLIYTAQFPSEYFTRKALRTLEQSTESAESKFQVCGKGIFVSIKVAPLF